MQHLHVERERQQRVEQAPGPAAHRILVIAEMGQRRVDEGVERRERFLAVERPAQLPGLRVAEALYTAAFDERPQGAMVMDRTRIRRLWRRARPGSAVVVVVVPRAALRLAARIQQQAVPAAHVAVEVLHQPLLAAREDAGQLVARSQEVFSVDLSRLERLLHGPAAQRRVQPPLIRRLPFDALHAVALREGREIRSDRLPVLRVVQRQEVHAVACLA